MSTTATTNPYKDLVIQLHELSTPDQWQLCAIDEGSVVSHSVFHADRDVALSRAKGLAGWFDAKLEIFVKKRAS